MGKSLVSNPPYNLKWKHPDLIRFLPQYMGWELPPESNANMAFVLSAIEMTESRAVLLLPNGVLSSGGQEGNVRSQLIDENLLHAVISLPGSMFESTSIPTCILVFDKHRQTRKIAMIDLSDKCKEEVRDQRGQFGGNAHEGRTYHKTINVIPADIMREVENAIDEGIDADGLCRWVPNEEVAKNNYVIHPKRYFETKTEIKYRSFEDIANDYNRIVRQKNAIKIRMNKTAAKRLGYDCFDKDRIDLTKSFQIVGQKVEKEDFITFGADDGIKISISTKESIHPLIVDFLNHWKQLIIYLNNEENRYLAEFRDALLPKLMNGEIEI